MGELKEWRDQNWVRINSSGEIAGECGTSKDKKNPDRCLPASKKREGAKGKTVVKNTKAAEVQNARFGGEITHQKAKRKSPRPKNGKVVARGCGKVLSNRRKFTSGSVST